jgi:hypothetical protein
MTVRVTRALILRMKCSKLRLLKNKSSENSERRWEKSKIARKVSYETFFKRGLASVKTNQSDSKNGGKQQPEAIVFKTIEKQPEPTVESKPQEFADQLKQIREQT